VIAEVGQITSHAGTGRGLGGIGTRRAAYNIAELTASQPG
jgi:hypothetical protein